MLPKTKVVCYVVCNSTDFSKNELRRIFMFVLEKSMDSSLSNNSEKTTLAKESTDSSENVVLPEKEENLLTGILIYFFCVWTCLLGLFQGLTLSVREILIFLP